MWGSVRGGRKSDHNVRESLIYFWENITDNPRQVTLERHCESG